MESFHLEFMILNDALAALPAISALAASMAYRASPSSYATITDEPLSVYKLTTLFRYSWATLAVNLILAVLTLYPDVQVHDLLTVFYWLVLLLSVQKFHAFRNVEYGSHTTLFLILLFNNIVRTYVNRDMIQTIISNIKSIDFSFLLNLKLVSLTFQILFSSLYILIIGFWSNRMDEDDEEAVSFF